MEFYSKKKSRVLDFFFFWWKLLPEGVVAESFSLVDLIVVAVAVYNIL